MTAPVYTLPERAEMTFVSVRHETGDELEALSEGCRVAVAEELRRLVADTSIEGVIGRWRLIERANALDPDGVPRNRPCGQCSALPHRPHRDDCPEVIGV